MKKKEFNFEELKKLAIPVKAWIRIGNSTVRPNPNNNGFYCTDTKSTLAFTAGRTLYLIPYHQDFKKILDEEGFLQSSMFVPNIEQYSIIGHIAEWQVLQNFTRKFNQ